MPILISFFLLLPSILYAQDIEISSNVASTKTSLKSSSCEILKKQKKALCEWKAKTEPGFQIPNPKDCVKLTANKYQLDVSECQPLLTKQSERSLYNEGPNCWGTAMSFQHISAKPRFMWPEEMMYWLDSPLCKKLEVNETKEPGDVISVFGPEYLQPGEFEARDAGINFWMALYPSRANQNVTSREGYTGYQRLVHSVTYITDEIAFGKDSPSKDDKFYFHSIEEVYGRPRRNNADCQENQSLVPYIRENGNSPKDFGNSARCNYYSIAHRCGDFDKYFNDNASSEEEKLILKTIRSLQEIQKGLFSLVSSTSRNLSPALIRNYLSLGDINLKSAEQELKKSGLSKTKEMLLVQQYFTAAAIRKSLSQAGLASE